MRHGYPLRNHTELFQTRPNSKVTTITWKAIVFTLLTQLFEFINTDFRILENFPQDALP